MHTATAPRAFHPIVSCLSHFSICPNVSSLDIGPSGSVGREAYGTWRVITIVLSPSRSLSLTGSLSCPLALPGHNGTDHSHHVFLPLPHPLSEGRCLGSRPLSAPGTEGLKGHMGKIHEHLHLGLLNTFQVKPSFQASVARMTGYWTHLSSHYLL